MYVYEPHVCSACKDRRGFWIPGSGVIDGCAPLYEYWESNLVLLEEQPVLLIASSLSCPEIDL